MKISIILRAIYDEHKRDELRNLRYMFRRMTTKCTEEVQQARNRLCNLKHEIATNPSSVRSKEIDTLFHQLSTLEEVSSKSSAREHFDRDINHSERSSKFFFRPPTPILRRVCIPFILRADGTLTTETKEMPQAHNTYWADILQSPSREYRYTKGKYDTEAMQDLLQHTTA